MKYLVTLYILLGTIGSLFAQVPYSDTVIKLQKNQSILLKKMFTQREKLMENNPKLQRLQQEKLRIHREMAEFLREDILMKSFQDEYYVLETEKKAQIELQTGKKIELKGEEK